MAWLKSHQVLSYFLFSLVAFCLFFLLGPSSSCSAASQSFTYDSTNNPAPTSNLDDSVVGFSYSFVHISLDSSNLNSQVQLARVYGLSGSGIQFVMSNITDSNGHTDIIFSTVRPALILLPNYWGTYTATVTFYDSLPTPTPCPDCPDIPETPYGDILDKIYHAILIASATMLVIYFFFIMFKWYLGGQ